MNFIQSLVIDNISVLTAVFAMQWRRNVAAFVHKQRDKCN